MENVLFNFRRKHQRHHNGHCHCQETGSNVTPVNAPEGCIPLTEAEEDKRLVVHANSDIKTMEMGLYPGSLVTLVHNVSGERNIIVKVHDQRYVIPREIATRIFVKN